MHWRIQLLIILLFLGTVIMGYLRYKRDDINRNAPAAQIEVAPLPDADGLADEDSESPEIKNFARVLAVPFDLSVEASQSAMLGFIAESKPGMVVLFGENISEAAAAAAIEEITNQVYEEERPLIAVDHEGGSVQRLSGDGFTILPSWKRMCDQQADLRRATLATSAAELKQVGIDVVLAPMVDVAESNPTLKDRVCDGDVDLVTAAANDYVAAFKAEQIVPVLKHYPGIGSVTIDLHNRFTTAEITESDAEPFKRVLDTHPNIGVMTSHVGVANQIAGVPCSQSFPCVNQIFELYPNVFTVADAIEMKSALYNSRNENLPKSIPTATIDALTAGNHLVIFGPDVTVEDLGSVLMEMKTEYTSSEEFRIRVNDAVARIEKIK